MEFVDRFQALVRSVSVVFDKPKPERSKCPRCKGSGLLQAHRILPWDRNPVSNEPCWFCEGIGVMPVAGLSGFMLGRASAVFQTRDLYVHNNRLPPVKAQLYLGKYPGTRPRVGTYKPCEEPESMLHDFSQPPQWLCGENLQSSDKVESDVKGGGGGGDKPMFTRKETTVVLRSPKSTRSSRGGSSGGSRSAQRVRVAPRLSRAQASPRAAFASTSTRQRLLLTEVPNFPRTSPKAATPASLEQSQNDDLQQAQASGPEFVRLRAPLLKSPKAFRTPRRGRNRVREEAEKAAAERARRVQGGICDSQPDASPAFVPENIMLVQADGAWDTREASNSHPRFLPWIESTRRSDYSWVNHMVYGSIKERSSQTPLPAKLLT